jgi:hypothetical protein
MLSSQRTSITTPILVEPHLDTMCCLTQLPTIITTQHRSGSHYPQGHYVSSKCGNLGLVFQSYIQNLLCTNIIPGLASAGIWPTSFPWS